jgi:hypothetical protein
MELRCPIVPLSPFGPFGYLYGEMMTAQTMPVTECNDAGLVTQSVAGNFLWLPPPALWWWSQHKNKRKRLNEGPIR